MTNLFNKIYGGVAAGVIGCAMGVPTEGMSHEEIKEKFGEVKTLLPSMQEEKIIKQPWGPPFHYKKLERIPGMGEDGLERHRLAVTAIIEKGGRITANDLARVWTRDINPEYFGYHLGPQDQIIYYLLKLNIPPKIVGRFAVWPGFIGTSKMMIPIGIINACNPKQAAQDAIEVGQIKDSFGPGNYALEVAAAVASAVAEALKPNATVHSIINVALSYLSEPPRKEVEYGLKLAEKYKNISDVRAILNEKYKERPPSYAPEVLTEALTILRLTDGNVKETILAAVNFGRDTDCIAYVAGGIAGALKGINQVPKEWIEIVNYAIKCDPYTVAKRSLEEEAKGLYAALKNNMYELKRQIELIEKQDQE